MKFGYLKFCGFAVEIPVNWDTSSLWLRGQDPGGGCLEFFGFVVTIPRSRSRLGYLKFVASRSRSRLGHLKFVATSSVAIAPWSRSRLGYTSSFVASWSRSRLGYLKFCGFLAQIPVGILEVCGIVVTIPVGIPQLVASRSRSRLGDPGWDTSGLWVRGQDPGEIGILQVLWLRGQDRYLRFVASQSRSRLEYLKFCGIPVKIAVGIPQGGGFGGQDPGWDASSLWLRGQDPAWHTSCLWQRSQEPGRDTSRSRSWLGYLKLVASCQDPGWGTSSFMGSWWLRDPDPGWDT